MVGTGLQPIAESYVVLIYGFVAANNVEVAKAVFASMQRAPVDARLGWYMLCTSLFNFGCVLVAFSWILVSKEPLFPSQMWILSVFGIVPGRPIGQAKRHGKVQQVRPLQGTANSSEPLDARATDGAECCKSVTFR